MGIQALQELRLRLESDSALQDFFTALYDKPPNFLIGYRSPNANNYPQVCIVLVRDKTGGLLGEDLTVSIVVGLHAPEFTDGQSDGVVNTLEAARLLRERLEADIVGAHTQYLGGGVIYTDKSAQHPFYEIELLINLRWRP